ncbi:MAG TPA: exodeoxyribonuclease V subunit alpha, partial [Paraburkholderia sp.]|uniref:exodeoxyribonuclease V subunit alpha n=1 Tax=Paraburkholderia sp. TaxID=1926495 RepID=UPI002B46AE44
MSTVATRVDIPAACPLASREATLELLAQWAEIGALNEIDVAFARFLAQETPDAPGLLLLAAALASHRLASGHVCLDLAATLAAPDAVLSLDLEDTHAGRERAPVASLADVIEHVTLASWQDALAHDDPVGEGPGAEPLVLAGSRLYLRRYWQYEQGVCRALGERAARLAQQTSELSESGLRTALDLLFPPPAQHGGAATPDWQKLACALAARSAFAIVTGGPGTGKTTTVVKLLALLQALALEAGKSGQPLRIRLAAPTGKAAARLNASIAGAIERLPLAAFRHGDAVRASIPTDVATLHRLLGKRPDSRHFRHGPGQLLPLDVLVIDEASMVDLEMMHGVLVALPPHARLILLGDKDQLASVEAGAVLGELCARAQAGHYTRQTRDWLARVSGEVIDDALVDPTGSALDQCIAMLRVSHRFDARSGIGKLAEAVNHGDASAVEAIWA